MQLALVSHLVPAFRDEIETTIAVPCTYDMEVACGKYFASLDDGEVPITILFSGMAFLDGLRRFPFRTDPLAPRSRPPPSRHACGAR